MCASVIERSVSEHVFATPVCSATSRAAIAAEEGIPPQGFENNPGRDAGIDMTSFASKDSPRPKGVLIVEDERLLRRSLEDGFKHRGFQVWVAADGAQGIELYQTFCPQIDVILSDVHMPVLEGPGMLEVLRQLNPQVRLCFMTGDFRAKKCEDLLRCGALRVFRKPFPSVAELAEDVWAIASVGSDSVKSTALRGEAPQCPVEVTVVLETLEVPDLLRWISARILNVSSWFGSAVTKKRPAKDR